MTLIIVTLSDGSNQQKYLFNQLTSPPNAPCPHLSGFRTSSCPHIKGVHTEKPESQSLTLTDGGEQSSQIRTTQRETNPQHEYVMPVMDSSVILFFLTISAQIYILFYIIKNFRNCRSDNPIKVSVFNMT